VSSGVAKTGEKLAIVLAVRKRPEGDQNSGPPPTSETVRCAKNTPKRYFYTHIYANNMLILRREPLEMQLLSLKLAVHGLG